MKRAITLCCMIVMLGAFSACNKRKKINASIATLSTAVAGVVAAKVVDTSLDVSKATMKTMGNTFKKFIPKPSWFKIPSRMAVPFITKSKAKASKPHAPHTHKKRPSVKVKEVIETQEEVTINAKHVMKEDHTCCIAVECTTGEDAE